MPSKLSKSISKKYLIKAISVAGGQAKLAEKIKELTGDDVRQCHVWVWENRNKKEAPPGEYCASIEAITGVPKWKLRPDLYEPPRGQHA